MLRRLGLSGVNAQLAACVSVMILVIETIVILPSIIVHFNHTLESEVERQLMLHHLAEYDGDLVRMPADTTTSQFLGGGFGELYSESPYESSGESPNESHSELNGEFNGELNNESHNELYGELYSGAAGVRNPYISIHNDRNLVAEDNAKRAGAWAVVASLSGWRDEWHVKHFAVTELMHMPLFSAGTGPIGLPRADADDLDDMHVRLAVPPDFMRDALMGHAIERGVLVLGVLLLAVVAFYLLVQSKVIRPLRQILDKITRLANHSDYRLGGLGALGQEGKTTFDDAHATLAHLDQYHLAQREKLVTIGEAVAKINHDMRNVLSAATLVTDGLVASKDPKVATAAPRVAQAINRAVELCQQMLTYINTPQKLNIKPTNMEMLMGEVRQALAVAVEYFGPKELCVDGGQFFRLLFNLALNAEKAGAKSVSMRVKGEKFGDDGLGGDGIVIDIIDDGSGMDALTKARLFKPFQSKNGSSGLGLSIARDIALGHGGGLCLVRTSKMGSVFRLRLPPQVLVKTGMKANRRRK